MILQMKNSNESIKNFFKNELKTYNQQQPTMDIQTINFENKNSSEDNESTNCENINSIEDIESTNLENNNECPRGFGKIRVIDKYNSISDKCLACYKFMDCFSETEPTEEKLATY